MDNKGESSPNLKLCIGDLSKC